MEEIVAVKEGGVGERVPRVDGSSVQTTKSAEFFSDIDQRRQEMFGSERKGDGRRRVEGSRGRRR
jgi:hypothetical protein